MKKTYQIDRSEPDRSVTFAQMSTRELGRRFRAARIKAGYTSAKAAAEAAGVSRAPITALENGRYSPTLAKLQRLVSALDLDARDLFEPLGVPCSDTATT